MRRLTDTIPDKPAAPVSADEFAALMRSFVSDASPSPIALAVSGGPDSMALAFCMRDWAMARNIALTAFIIDHALRETSASEAAMTQERLVALGVASDILRWDHDPVITRLHVRARHARYALLTTACRTRNIRHLMTAHHRNDQAETILMRLAKGSGIDGLAGMAAQGMKEDIHIWRPFLALGKNRLIATCAAAGIPFVTDKSNNSDNFARGRLRRILPLLADEGLTIERLIDLGQRAATAKDALDHATRLFLKNHTQMDISGALSYNAEAFRVLPLAIAERALIEGLQCIHPEDYAPEHASLTVLCAALRENAGMPTRTLHGCLVTRGEKRISLMRETAGIQPVPIRPGESLVWDDRWQVALAEDAQDDGLTLRPLGMPAHDILDRLASGLHHDIPQGRARASLPSLWKGDELVSIASFRSNEPPGMLQAELRRNWRNETLTPFNV